MLIEERRQHILSLIQKHGRVLVDELSQDLNLSKITIRKDLDYLQSRDLLVRTHGGALPAQAGALSDPTIQEKGECCHEQERYGPCQNSKSQIRRGWEAKRRVG